MEYGVHPVEVAEEVLRTVNSKKQEVLMANPIPRAAVYIRTFFPELFFAIVASGIREKMKTEEDVWFCPSPVPAYDLNKIYASNVNAFCYYYGWSKARDCFHIPMFHLMIHLMGHLMILEAMLKHTQDREVLWDCQQSFNKGQWRIIESRNGSCWKGP